VLDLIVHHFSVSPICLLVLCMSCVCQLLNKRIYDDGDDDDDDAQPMAWQSNRRHVKSFCNIDTHNKTKTTDVSSSDFLIRMLYKTVIELAPKCYVAFYQRDIGTEIQCLNDRHDGSYSASLLSIVVIVRPPLVTLISYTLDIQQLS